MPKKVSPDEQRRRLVEAALSRVMAANARLAKLERAYARDLERLRSELDDATDHLKLLFYGRLK